MDFAQEDKGILTSLKDKGYSPRTIADVGGSEGWWSAHISQVFPQSHYDIFEPLAYEGSNHYRTIQENTKNVDRTIHGFALGSSKTRAKFNIMGDQGAASSFLGSFDGPSLTEVQIDSLDNLIETGWIQQPNIIKLDVQGYELEILAGGTRRALPGADLVMLETWMTRGYGADTPLMHEIFQFMGRNNFYPFAFADKYVENGLLISQDVWFARAGSEAGKFVWQALHEVQRPGPTPLSVKRHGIA